MGMAADQPVCLYTGHVVHARLRPRKHRFAYRVFSILIDLDRLQDASSASPLFSVNRLNVLSFHERDHGPGDGSSLRLHVDKLLRESGSTVEGSRIFLLCYPRVFGFVFNPLAVYYIIAADGSLAALLYEVRNTFGGRHTYPVIVRPQDVSVAGVRHTLRKAFHVSPFLGMQFVYRFSLDAPGDELRLRIVAADDNGPVLVTGLAGRRRTMSTPGILALLARNPAMTLKVLARIHWEALKLWIIGVPIDRRGFSRRGGDQDAGLGSEAVETR
jgi:DUF1365 family protein